MHFLYSSNFLLQSNFQVKCQNSQYDVFPSIFCRYESSDDHLQYSRLASSL